MEAVASHLNLTAEMEPTPFHVAFVFGVNEEAIWAGVCNAHAPQKELKVRGLPTPCINVE